jgi:hypothetical protein
LELPEVSKRASGLAKFGSMLKHGFQATGR